jgi:hypothetical protein
MPELLDAFDAYKEFEKSAYFTVCFDAIASSMRLRLPLPANKENMQAVIDTLDLDAVKAQTIFKKWKIKAAKDAEPDDDFCYDYAWKSTSQSLLIQASLDEEELIVEFLYDLADAALEAWVIATKQALRRKFGERKTPTFKVLTHNDRFFYTEDVSIGQPQTGEISALYNDDFQEIDALIMATMSQEESGLILLHGEPGTGKTSYIKRLVSAFPEKSFIYIQNDFVQELLKPQFITFLLQHRHTVLIIEDAEKVIMSREYNSESSVVSTILQLTDGLFSDFLNIKIVCTFNTSVEKIDKALLRKGRMIADYEFGPLSLEKTTQLAQSLGMKPELIEGKMTLADIFRLTQRGFNSVGRQSKIGFNQ